MMRKLNISYEGINTWLFPILNQLDDCQRQTYRDSDLREWGFSISSKLDMIYLLTGEINKKIISLINEFKDNPSETEECLSKGFGYQVNNQEDVFLLLAYMESVFFEMYSVRDLLIKYIPNFIGRIFNEEISKEQLMRGLEDGGVSLDLLEDLGKVRNDLIHNYTGWIAFEEKAEGLRLVIDLPSFENQEFKGYRETILTDKDIRDSFDNFRKLLEAVHNLLFSRFGKKAQVSHPTP